MTEGASLAAARAAEREFRWADAADAFRVVATESGDPAALEGLAQCAWWLDDGALCLQAREAACQCTCAHRSYLDAGDALSAARAATSLAWDSLLFGHGASVAQGWLGRARGLLAGEPEKREHGWLAVREAELAHAASHDPAESLEAAGHAAAVGRRHHDPDLEQAGLAFAGLTLVGNGKVTAGMELLDAAAVAATAGDVRDPMWMGKICCWLIAACVQAQDVERAAQWCRRIADVSARQGLMPLFNVCRVRYAELCILRGDWAEAERDLSAAIERLVNSRRDTRLSAVAQLGELRRRQGRQQEADELLRQAEFVPEARVSRALLALDRGDPVAAWKAIAEVLAEIPPAAQLDRAAVLPSAVVVALAAGDPDAAASAVAELKTIAARIGTDRLLGQAAAATGRLAADVGAWPAAGRHFNQAGLRFDEAEARYGLGQALLTDGATDEANEHLECARGIFDEIGAPHRAATLRALAGRRSAGLLTERQVEVLALVARGLTNGEIARQLHLSEHTVHRHLSNSFTALGVSSRAAATAYVLSNGLINRRAERANSEVAERGTSAPRPPDRLSEAARAAHE